MQVTKISLISFEHHRALFLNDFFIYAVYDEDDVSAWYAQSDAAKNLSAMFNVPVEEIELDEAKVNPLLDQKSNEMGCSVSWNWNILYDDILPSLEGST